MVLPSALTLTRVTSVEHFKPSVLLLGTRPDSSHSTHI